VGAARWSGVSVRHSLEAFAIDSLANATRTRSWSSTLALGERLGSAAFTLGIRRQVAERNLAIAFPERTAHEHRAILAAHYRELGRVVVEYPRLPELVRTPLGDRVAELNGLENVEQARSLGRGIVFVTGHFGNFELMGAYAGQRFPLDVVVKPLTNPIVEARVAALRREAGVGIIPIGAGVRRIFEALRANHGVAMLADQDARRHGVFVSFFGRPTSTAEGPARLALRTGAPMIVGFDLRQPDGRHVITLLPPLPRPAPDDPDPVRTLTQSHVAVLESWIRRHPEMWFWLHRRWKTAPPERG
jgi:Kdo2-lipid IVA lauroyltransferase/acyltransferase